ncbi:MAG: Carboxypeptidase regulatory-like domain [Deltaproteobacteria bacterium]|nr:Carboxypeptidase regulatory-like domain [Deltaproteobacteria bacterium]
MQKHRLGARALWLAFGALRLYRAQRWNTWGRPVGHFGEVEMMLRVRHAVAIAAAAILSSCGVDHVTSPPTTGAVEGVVSDLLGNGLEGVTVVLVDPTTLATASPLGRTDAAGHYRIDGMTAGDYAVFLYGFRCMLVSTFARMSPLVRVEAGSTTIRHESLVGGCIWFHDTYISGTVTDAVTGVPLVGAYVSNVLAATIDRYAFEGITVYSWGVTDANGQFSIVAEQGFDDSFTTIGILPISITKLGYEPVTLVGRGSGKFVSGPALPAPIPPDTALVVAVALHPLSAGAPTGALSGRVNTPNGPIAGIHVVLSLAGIADPDTIATAAKACPGQPGIEVLVPGKSAVTDDSGRFLISNLHPGMYVVHAAIIASDGFVGDPQGLIAVVPSDTVDAGDVRVVTALTRIAPTAGSSPPTTEPILLQWSPPPIGVQVTRYRVQFGVNSYFLENALSTDQSSVSIGALPANTAVRWYVEAFHVTGTDSVRVGAFEEIASFKTAGS